MIDGVLTRMPMNISLIKEIYNSGNSEKKLKIEKKLPFIILTLKRQTTPLIGDVFLKQKSGQ
jgi:hypothetical protein